MPEPILKIRGLQKSYGHVQALRQINLDVNEGEVVAILGPSGSGKSTLVRCIHQLEPIQGGAMYLNGELLGYECKGNRLVTLSDRDQARQRARIGMVFQLFNLFEHKTVLENLVVGQVKVMGRARAEAIDRAKFLLEKVHLSDKAKAYPRQLSGGQKQRVAIARAMANRPAVILFDEPTSALDPELVAEVLEVILEIAETGTTMIIVTHEVNFARDIASRIIFMEKGEVVADGPVEEIMSQPTTTRIGAFLSRSL